MAQVNQVPIGHLPIDPEYWHIGAMTIRLLSVSPPSLELSRTV